MLDAGLNPDLPTYGIQQLHRRAYWIMLPVLVEVATNPALSADPSLIRARMLEPVQGLVEGKGARQYQTSQLPAVRQALLDAFRATPPSEGAIRVAAILADPNLGPPWQATLAGSLEARPC